VYADGYLTIGERGEFMMIKRQYLKGLKVEGLKS